MRLFKFIKKYTKDKEYINTKMNFEDQLNEIRNPIIQEFFKNRNLLKFIKTHINIENLCDKNKDKDLSIFQTFSEINTYILEDDVIKKYINEMKT